ncbi:MAG: rhomboid family intramembrane serine protease [Planctomycetota bacterium]|jgi:membrane associated rhomboid family serine protease
MLIPYRTSIQPRRTPYANYLLIGINILVYLLQFRIDPHTNGLDFRPWVSDFVLRPRVSPWWTLVTYAFLHGDHWHIFFNMFFLYLFGKNINDKLGHMAYIVFYLCSAAASGFGHAMLHAAPEAVPVMGASGAVAAVTGAYLVLFPQTLLTVVYWFFFIGTIEVPALYFILLKLIFLDNVLARGPGNIAYDAHLAGYGFGIVMTLLLLATRLVSSTNFDLWAMIKQWSRRRHYRDAVASGYDPFGGSGERRPVTAKEVKKTVAEKQKEIEVREIRNAISQRLEERNLPAAADLYVELMKVDCDQVLSRQHLLDIANQLASSRRSSQAAYAYEQFLTHYGTYEHAEQVELMLGILYARYLQRPEEATRHLQRAAERLTDEAQIKMCREELSRLQE